MRDIDEHRDQLQELASTGSAYTDFAPYVAAMSAGGRVAFQARCADGRSRLVVDGVAQRATEHELCSHPVISDAGHLAYYARLQSGARALCYFDGERWLEDVLEVGPLGPTMNSKGLVAYRAQLEDGPAIVLWKEGQRHVVADSRQGARDFVGLPLVTEDAQLVYQARAQGRSTLYRWHGQGTDELLTSGADFAEFGAFAFAAREGGIALVARDASGVQGIYVVHGDGSVSSAMPAGDTFAELRGALLVGEELIFYARRHGAELAIYRARQQQLHCVLATGDPYQDSFIASFALNPVSVDGSGQLAIRLQLASGRGVIVRACAQPVA